MTPPPEPPKRRETDDEDRDYTEYRRRITGTEPELRVGVGKWSVTLKGGGQILIILQLAAIGLQGWHINDMVKTTTELRTALIAAVDKSRTATEKSLRVSLCISRLSAAQIEDWRKRSVQDPQTGLVAYCPELMFPLAP